MNRRKITLAVGLLSFFSLGWSIASVSTSLPKIIQDFRISYDVSGFVAGLLQLGGVAGFAAGALADKLGYVKTVAAAILTFVVGLGLTSLTVNLWMLSIGFLAIGIGSVLLVSSASPLVVIVFSGRGSSVMNYMYAGWGFGIGIGSVLTALFAEINWRLSFLTPIPAALLLFILALSRLDEVKPAKVGFDRTILMGILRKLPLATVTVFIVGVEVSFITWLPTLLTATYKAGVVSGGIAVTLFSTFMGMGRALFGRVTDYIGSVKSITLLGGAASLLFFIFSVIEDAFTKLFVLPFIGLFVGPLLPTFTAWIIKQNPEIGGSISGISISFGRVGTFLITWLVGVTLALYGGFWAEIIFAVACFTMITYLRMAIRVTQPSLRTS